MDDDVVYIVNPAAANGRVGRRWPRVRRILDAGIGRASRAVLTDGPMHAASIARDAVRGGASTVVAVGGDGTLNEIANGFLDPEGRPWEPRATVGLVSLGTGADFVRTLGISAGDPADAARRIRRGDVRRIDVGRCEFTGPAGPTTRHFVNVAEFGSGGAVVDRVNRTTKVLGGRVSFLLAILRTMRSYRNTRVAFSADGGPRTEVVMNDFIVANGRFFGGGLQPAPRAELSDGLLDAVIVGDVDFRTIRRNLPSMRAGTHLDLPEVTHFRCERLEIHAGEEMIDLDGEYVGRHPTRMDVVPRALPLIA